MKIEIFGPGCAKCNSLEKNIKEAVTQLGSQAEVVKVSDINEMVKRGVMFTPALFIEGKKMSEGKVPSMEDIKSWIK